MTLAISDCEFSHTLDNILNNLNQSKNFIPSIVIGVSGGPDSMALSLLLKNWSKKNNCNLLAVIIDHKLRSDSSNEAYQTQKNLLKLGINSIVNPLESQTINGGIQEWARNERFKVFFDIANSKNSILAIAQNYEDQVETLLMRTFKNSGFFGAGGIKELSFRNNTFIIRPLLKFSKKRLIETCDINKVNYFIDPSNFDPKFERVRIRNSLKYFNKINLDIGQIYMMGSAITKLSNEIEKIFFSQAKDNFTIHPLGWISIDSDWFFKTPKIILIVIMRKLLMKIGGAMYPPNREKLNNLIDYMFIYKDNFYKMPSKTLAGCKIRFWKDKIIILRLVRSELPFRLIKNWNKIIFDNRWLISSNKNIKVHYPSKINALCLRKKFDKKKELPWEIWTAIPICSDCSLLKSSILNLDESNLNNHLSRYSEFINYMCYINKIKIKFLF